MEDLRTIKTKKNLYDALILLMKQTNFENIKVADICKYALVNRSTFYNHYQDKYDLLDDMLTNLKNKIFNLNNYQDIKSYYLSFFSTLLDYINEHKKSFTDILINNKNGIMIDILLNKLVKDILDNTKLKEKEIVVKFYLGGTIYLITEYLNRDKYTKKDMLDYLDKLIQDI
ncbi:MAG: TetR/AcrR family transcriptional regulator [Erysipelotrichaceae bacterium]|nr:TetR/AcrR family transcriptional regulator [Erysipelotrichaceae bacterium]